VGPPTLNPPQSQRTTSGPQKGIVEIKLVITVAPQKDIWPQGRTYPKKAVPITNKRMVTPDIQVFSSLKLRKNSPRPKCKNKNKKNNEAPFR
jgi:hypothetical protein